jgi:hypothetical protein
MKKMISKIANLFGYRLEKINKPIGQSDYLDSWIDFSRPTYVSYIPDKYSDNLALYKNNFYPFFDKADINNWIKGNEKNNSGDLSRFYFLNLVIDQLIEENIEGDIAELGVYKGNTAFLLAKYARSKNKTAYLFDTYEGFDEREVQHFDKTVAQAFNDTSLEYVQKFIGTENVIYVKGFFPESLREIKKINETQFCLVHIDCDLAEPFKAALDFFYPKLVIGGTLVMHDHASLYWPEAKRVIDNFFKDKREKLLPIPDKSGTVIIRKSS